MLTHLEELMMNAACKRDLDLFDALIALRVNVNVQDENGKTPLMCAARNGHTRMMWALLGVGAQAEIVDNQGWNTMMWAVVNNHMEAVKILLRVGICLEAENVDGNTALMLAMMHGHIKIAAMLALEIVRQEFLAPNSDIFEEEILDEESEDDEIDEQENDTTLSHIFELLENQCSMPFMFPPRNPFSSPSDDSYGGEDSGDSSGSQDMNIKPIGVLGGDENSTQVPDHVIIL